MDISHYPHLMRRLYPVFSARSRLICANYAENMVLFSAKRACRFVGWVEEEMGVLQAAVARATSIGS